jgi:sulfofructose kinase
MAEVICVGNAVLDHIYDVPALPVDDETVFAHGYHTTGAGAAANAAVAINRLGGTGVLWSRLGDDETGVLILADLVRNGVDVGGIRQIAGGQSPISTVAAAGDGRRQTTFFDGAGLPDEAGWLPLGRIEQTGAVLVEPGWTSGTEAVMRATREHRIPTVLMIDVLRDTVPQSVARGAEYVIFSPAGLAQFAGGADPVTALAVAADTTGAIVGVTSGPDGFRWHDADGTPRREPPVAVDLVDPACAWEVFCGTFALALAEEKEPGAAIRFANVAAALTAAARGGRRSIPDRRTVWQRLESTYGPIDDDDG